MPRQTSRDLRNESRFEVLHALFTLGPSTRQEIAKHTGLSTATVATLVTQFLAEGVLRIATVEQNTGRPPVRAAHHRPRPRPHPRHRRGRDVRRRDRVRRHPRPARPERGRARRARERPGVRRRRHRPRDRGGGRGQRHRARAASSAPASACPARSSPDAGVSVFAPNWDWHDVKIEDLLEERLGMPVYVDNPLKAVALSEMWFGVGRVTKTMAVVNLGTGVGAGIAIDGSLLRGAANNAGRVGSHAAAAGRPAVPVRPAWMCRGLSRGARAGDVAGGDRPGTPRAPAAASSAASSTRSRTVSPRTTRLLLELARRTSHYLAASLGDLVNLLNIPHITLTGLDHEARWLEWLIPAVTRRTARPRPAGFAAGADRRGVARPGQRRGPRDGAFTLEQFLGALGLASPASAPTTRRRLRRRQA